MAVAMYPWLVLAIALILLVVLGHVLYHHYTDPKESYQLAMVTVILSLSVSFLCTLLIPIDIYVISQGDINAEALHLKVSRDLVRTAYLSLFSLLLFLAFFLVPYAYFYGEERGDVGDDPVCGRAKGALRSTGFFVGFILTLLLVGLNFRPGKAESLDSGDAARWVDQLLDLDHNGLNAVCFCIACLTLAGVLGWALYTAYGLAAMPFDWLRSKQSASEQRQELEQSIAAIREKYQLIQAKYTDNDNGGGPDLSTMRAADRREFTRLQREQRNLTQYNYRLQELEQRAGALIPQILLCLVPFRFAIGVSMLVTSLLVVLSLLITLVDRFLHSSCGWECGYSVKARSIFNPTDEVLLVSSRFFPLDFIILGFIVLYAFAASVYGIAGLGIRFLCINIYTLRSRRSLPQALLVLCNILSHILLALCMVLLTIAPDYTAYGAQAEPKGAHSTHHVCPSQDVFAIDELASEPASCRISMIATFFARITLSMPLFSVAYYLANWVFVVVFFVVFAHCAACQERKELVNTKRFEDEENEEEVGLLSLT
mmetsp:Transcript_31229/g.57089  ORF Transcript_31229/g.57089 Transcript_31229/m.57089 type:complete len:542 (+) Transcript_31229:84-1709(+)